MEQKKGLVYYSITAVFIIFLIGKGISSVVDANREPADVQNENNFVYTEQGSELPESPYYSYLESSPFATEPKTEPTAAPEQTSATEQTSGSEETTQNTGNADIVYELTNDELAEFILKSIGEDVPIQSMEVKLSADGTANVSASGNKKEIMDYLSDKNVSIPAAVSAISIILPNDLDLDASLTIGCDPESGLVSVSINSVKVSDVTVPESILNSSLVDKANQKINNYITEKGIYFNDITIEDGKIILDAVPAESSKQ